MPSLSYRPPVQLMAKWELAQNVLINSLKVPTVLSVLSLNLEGSGITPKLFGFKNLSTMLAKMDDIVETGYPPHNPTTMFAWLRPGVQAARSGTAAAASATTGGPSDASSDAPISNWGDAERAIVAHLRQANGTMTFDQLSAWMIARNIRPKQFGVANTTKLLDRIPHVKQDYDSTGRKICWLRS